MVSKEILVCKELFLDGRLRSNAGNVITAQGKTFMVNNHAKYDGGKWVVFLGKDGCKHAYRQDKPWRRILGLDAFDDLVSGIHVSLQIKDGADGNICLLAFFLETVDGLVVGRDVLAADDKNGIVIGKRWGGMEQTPADKRNGKTACRVAARP